MFALKVYRKDDNGMLFHPKACKSEIDAMNLCSGVKGILQIYEIIETAQNVVLVTEHCDGGDLIEFAMINQITSFDESLVKRITKAIVAGLGEMHAKGLIHRDVKLDNILMTNDSLDADPIIADLGQSVSFQDKVKC